MAASECSLFSPEYLLKTYLWILELTFLVSKRTFVTECSTIADMDQSLSPPPALWG